ncbi:Utp14-domain-containing protein [Mycena pura]|uniref:Utp14-domain-containing protein n=1 Tax=Mycena pura TaxID=153505 RepID=A0AAD6VID8_9AGAR|nr:Utp14-domain-containing protein [Mycena pura]
MLRSRRPSASKPIGKDAKSKANNAAGYLKRRTAKTATARIQDVYELVETEGGRRGKGKKSRRETVDLKYDFGEDGADGRDEETDEEEQRQPRLIGEEDSIGSDDDEDIDSDAAFEDIDGDADGFAGVFSRKNEPTKKKKAKVKFVDVDLDEDEDINMSDAAEEGQEDEDLDSDTYIDILDVMDGKGEVYNGDSDGDEGSRSLPEKSQTPLLGPATATQPDDEDEELDSQEENESGDASDSDDDDDDQLGVPDDADEIDTSPEALTALHDFISKLPSDAPPPPSTKRKADADGDGNIAPRKRRALPALQERTQAGVEDEFQVGNTTGAPKLSLDDLLAPLSSVTPDALRAVRKSLGAGTIPAETRPKTKSTGKKVKPIGGGALAAPLPTRTQARVDREAAYEATKEEVEKWAPSMKRIREAEHLSFPLQAPKQQVGRVSNAELAAKFKPTTELETAVSRLLATANLAQDADIQRTENQLMAATLTPEEVVRRRNELRQMRELAFRGETKARRVAKIKSKVYRKIARGKKQREAAREGGGDDTEDEGSAMQREVDRARERAGLRVRRNAKWNRARAEGEEDQDETEGLGGRQEIEIELEREERLQRLIRGEKDDASSGDDDSGDESGEDGIKRSAFNELKALDDVPGDEPPAKHQGVFGMKFMQAGMQRQNMEAKRMADDFVEEMSRLVDEDADGNEGDGPTAGVIAQRTGGRVSFRPGTDDTAKAVPMPLENASITSPARSLSPPPVSAKASQPRPLLSSSASAVEENPWLVSTSSGPKAPRAKNNVVVSKDSKSVDKARHKLAKNEKKLDKVVVAAARDDAVVEIEMDNVLGSNEGQKQKPSENTIDGDDGDGTTSEANSEVDAQERALMLKKKGKGGKADTKAFEQRDLVALAFAGDNVVRDFEEAKKREIASDAPRNVDTTLPGWGSWGGPNARKGKPKPKFIKKIPGIAPTDRADHGKAHIIISEKRDKKAAKYQVKDLPYPFTSVAQYERSLEAPLGTEWNTRVAFQKGTLPRVVKKMGMVIEPLQKLV